MAENPFPVAPPAFTSAVNVGDVRIELRGFPMKFNMRVLSGQDFLVSYKAQDVNGGGLVEVQHARFIGDFPRDDTAHLVHEVRRAILAVLEHELDECLFVNGVRVRDPHEGES